MTNVWHSCVIPNLMVLLFTCRPCEHSKEERGDSEEEKYLEIYMYIDVSRQIFRFKTLFSQILCLIRLDLKLYQYYVNENIIKYVQTAINKTRTTQSIVLSCEKKGPTKQYMLTITSKHPP